MKQSMSEAFLLGKPICGFVKGKKKKEGKGDILYFSFDGWMKYIASMDGNGCLLLKRSSTTVIRNEENYVTQ